MLVSPKLLVYTTLCATNLYQNASGWAAPEGDICDERLFFDRLAFTQAHAEAAPACRLVLVDEF
jgi:hypothetical protein